METKTYQLELLIDRGSESDPLSNLLTENGLDDFAELTTTQGRQSIVFYRDNQEDLLKIELFIRSLKTDVSFEVHSKAFDSQIWKHPWSEGFEYFETQHHIFTPPGKEFSGDKKILFIDPHAFGTGAHVTTRAVGILLERLSASLTDKSVFLDVGTGTGIFAAWAESEGFTTVIGTDICEAALQSAETTRKLNGLNFELVLGSFPSKIASCSVIVCNILPPELYEVLSEITQHMSAETILIIAGFNRANLDEALESCDRHKLRLIEQEEQMGWLALALVKK